jgi:hypothetical protein
MNLHDLELCLHYDDSVMDSLRIFKCKAIRSR